MPQPAALWPSPRNVLRQRLTIFSSEYYQILTAARDGRPSWPKQHEYSRLLLESSPGGTQNRKIFHITKIYTMLCVIWETFTCTQMFTFKIATLTFKPLESGQLPYLAQQLCAYAPTRALRSSTSKLLQVSRTSLRFGSRSFCASAPTLWNSLPRSVRFCESLTTSRKHLKTFYIQSAFPDAP